MKYSKCWSCSQCLFLSTLLSLATTVFGQAPSGTFSYHFTPTDGPALWNFSGNYAASYYVTDDILELRHHANGDIEANYQTPGLASGGVYGAVRGRGSLLHLKLTSEMSQPTTTPDVWKRRRDRLSLSFDEKTRTLAGIDRTDEAIRMVVYDAFPYSHMKTLAHWSSNSVVTLEVPEATDGAWTLILNITPTGNKLAGTALVQFGNGMTYELQLTGSYSPKRQTSKVLLTGTGSSKGATLVLSFVNPDMGIERMSGRLGGQSVKF